MTAFGRVAPDGEEVPTPSNGDDWRLAWHPPASAPPGQPHGANAFCVTADGEVVLISSDGQGWGWPGGRPEPGESRKQTLEREILEEACATVTGARLLGFVRGRCTDGRERAPVDRAGCRADLCQSRARGGADVTRRRRQTMTQDEADIVTKLSPHPVAETVSKLTGMISAKGIRLFAVIDQSAEARQAGLSLRETTLVIFGSPAAGTPVMAAAPLAALDLPLKVLVWDDDGQTKVSYYSPDALAARHHLSAGLAGNLAAVNALTDALTAS